MSKEEWKEISEKYADKGEYYVSNKGRIYSKKRNKMMKPYWKTDYLYISLNKNKESKAYVVHRIVAQAFVPKAVIKKLPTERVINTQNLRVIHRDGNYANNDAENLEWCTMSYQKRAQNRTNKPIKGMNLKTGEILWFNSIIEAGKYISKDTHYNFPKHCLQDIVAVCNGDKKHCHGWAFKWVQKGKVEKEVK